MHYKYIVLVVIFSCALADALLFSYLLVYIVFVIIIIMIILFFVC